MPERTEIADADCHSTVQRGEQPSPGRVLASSHCSGGSVTPLPQRMPGRTCVQKQVRPSQNCPGRQGRPMSHCSGGSMRALPHRGKSWNAEGMEAEKGAEKEKKPALLQEEEGEQRQVWRSQVRFPPQRTPKSHCSPGSRRALPQRGFVKGREDHPVLHGKEEAKEKSLQEEKGGQEKSLQEEREEASLQEEREGQEKSLQEDHPLLCEACEEEEGHS